MYNHDSTYQGNWYSRWRELTKIFQPLKPLYSALHQHVGPNFHHIVIVKILDMNHSFGILYWRIMF